MSGFSPGPQMRHLSGLIPSQSHIDSLMPINATKVISLVSKRSCEGLNRSMRRSDPIFQQTLTKCCDFGADEVWTDFLRRHVGEERPAQPPVMRSRVSDIMELDIEGSEECIYITQIKLEKWNKNVSYSENRSQRNESSFPTNEQLAV